MRKVSHILAEPFRMFPTALFSPVKKEVNI